MRCRYEISRNTKRQTSNIKIWRYYQPPPIYPTRHRHPEIECKYMLYSLTFVSACSVRTIWSSPTIIRPIIFLVEWPLRAKSSELNVGGPLSQLFSSKTRLWRNPAMVTPVQAAELMEIYFREKDHVFTSGRSGSDASITLPFEGGFTIKFTSSQENNIRTTIFAVMEDNIGDVHQRDVAAEYFAKVGQKQRRPMAMPRVFRTNTSRSSHVLCLKGKTYLAPDIQAGGLISSW